MEELIVLENRLKTIKEALSKIEITSEFVELTKQINELTEVTQQIDRIKWRSLSQNEKIEKRKEDLRLISKYHEKFKEEIGPKYIFKKEYVQLVDNILELKAEMPLILILLNSLNTSMYVDFQHKDYNINFIIDELDKIKISHIGIAKIISSYKKLLDFYKSNSGLINKKV